MKNVYSAELSKVDVSQIRRLWYTCIREKNGKTVTDDFRKINGFSLYVSVDRVIPVIAMSRRILRDQNGLYRRIGRGRKRRVSGCSMKFAPSKCRLMREHRGIVNRKPDSNISSAELVRQYGFRIGVKKFSGAREVKRAKERSRRKWKFVGYRVDKFVINKYLGKWRTLLTEYRVF